MVPRSPFFCICIHGAQSVSPSSRLHSAPSPVLALAAVAVHPHTHDHIHTHIHPHIRFFLLFFSSNGFTNKY